MNETYRGVRAGAAEVIYPRVDYVYRGTVPLEKDPEVAKSYLHGTASAARLHYLRGEKRCDECAEFERARGRERTAKRRAEKEASA